MQQLKKTFIRGLALAIPLAVVGYVFIKFMKIFEQLISPVAGRMGIEKLLGEITLSIFAILCILMLTMALGLLMQLAFIASFTSALEAIVLKFFPWLNQLKALAADSADMENAVAYWQPVLVYVENNYHPAFLVDESETLVSFFIIKGPKPQEGEMMTTEKSLVKYFPIERSDIMAISRQRGKGTIELVEKSLKPD